MTRNDTTNHPTIQPTNQSTSREFSFNHWLTCDSSASSRGTVRTVTSLKYACVIQRRSSWVDLRRASCCIAQASLPSWMRLAWQSQIKTQKGCLLLLVVHDGGHITTRQQPQRQANKRTSKQWEKQRNQHVRRERQHEAV